VPEVPLLVGEPWDLIPAAASLRADTYDVYVSSKGTVRLVDLNPVGGTTSPLLFDWAELPYQHRTHGAAQNGVAEEPQVCGTRPECASDLL
jgi:hypothetical protein